jgi:hypothetical protein
MPTKMIVLTERMDLIWIPPSFRNGLAPVLVGQGAAKNKTFHPD